MKPVSIRFKCFGPYMAEQYIDFRELEKNGLFLICGETGAGKTTILDAMCYALYGRSSGGLRGDMSVMRCKLAGKEDETYVEFLFDSDGRRYKFTRTLKYGRKNLNDSHNCLVLEGEEYVPLFENPKATVVNKKAEELIGLTYDQFRQVIILPQGQFEKLLVSDSVEKEKILVSLFHADRWQKIADELYRRVAEWDAALKQEKFQISTKLKEYSCESLPELAEKRQDKQNALEELKARLEAAEQAVTAQRKRHEEALLEDRAFQELRNREKAYLELLARAEDFHREEEILDLADAAAAIHPQFAAWQEAQRGKLRAESVAAQKEAALQAAQSALTGAEAKLTAHETSKPEQEQRRQKLTLLETAREVYTVLAEKWDAVKAAQTAMDAARREKDSAERTFQICDEDWQAAVLEQNRAIGEYQNAQTVYLQGIGSVLAEKLAEGEPCPVCGSREHPAPAQPIQGHVTDAQLENLNKAMNRANRAVSTAMQKRSEAEKARTDAAASCNQAEQTLAVAVKDWENAEARKIPGIENARQLETAVAALQKQITDWDREGERLTKALTDAQGSLKAALDGARTAAEELAAAQSGYAAQAALWEDALAASGLETEERFRQADLEPGEKQRRLKALLGYRTDAARAKQAVDEQRVLLAGKNAPDMAALNMALSDAEQAFKAVSTEKILEENSLKAMISDEKRLSKQLEAYGAAREKADGDLDFANRFRGRSGVSLQRYVLGVMLTSITAEANRLLANVYGGRYRLYRTDEIAGAARKGGLELEVYDSQNNQRRSVTTLSGGEKFLVALSLAIGLSTVVQAQGSGIRLEAMFIDEGFGSLDREAVNDALEVLQGIQRSAGVVGIISHVEQLTESIPTRIEIVKSRNGSTCRVLNG